MRPRAVDQHVKARVQPEVDLDADAIVVTVGMPAQRQQVLPGAGKTPARSGRYGFHSGVCRAGNVAVRYQQL